MNDFPTLVFRASPQASTSLIELEEELLRVDSGLSIRRHVTPVGSKGAAELVSAVSLVLTSMTSLYPQIVHLVSTWLDKPGAQEVEIKRVVRGREETTTVSTRGTRPSDFASVVATALKSTRTK